MNKKWIKAAAIRAVKPCTQTAIAISYLKRLGHTAWQGAGGVILAFMMEHHSISEIDWKFLIDVALYAAILSLLKSWVVGTPESKSEVEKDE